jgi:hypothetical protein
VRIYRVFENRVLRRISESKGEEVMGDGRYLLNEELHNLDYSPDIIRMIKSRRLRWTGHAECMGKLRSPYKLIVGKPEEKDHREDVDVDKCADWIHLAGSCEHGNEPSGSVKFWKVVD